MQAKTFMRCNDRLSDIGTLTVTNGLYYRANSNHSWPYMTTNTGVCKAATVSNESNGRVQCRTEAEDFHPLMIAGVNAPCLKGTRYDYLQTSSASLVTDEGRRYAGASFKSANNVHCKGS